MMEPITVSNDDMQVAAIELGMTRLGPSMVQSLRTLGVGLEGAGTVRVQHGAVLMTTNEMLNAIKKLSSLMNQTGLDAETACRVSNAMAGATRAIATITKVASNIAARDRDVSLDAERQKRRSFIPCSMVQNNYYGVERLAALEVAIEKASGS